MSPSAFDPGKGCPGPEVYPSCCVVKPGADPNCCPDGGTGVGTEGARVGHDCMLLLKPVESGPSDMKFQPAG